MKPKLKAATLVSLALLWGGLLGPARAQDKPAFLAPPPEFIPPPLNPTGVQLQPKELAPGVYALLSTRPPVDNSGFVVGERGVLVIDSHINGAMARQIQAAVRQVTNKPILYLVNTNYFGDHWFGNYAFPATTLILAQRHTAEGMRDFERMKQGMLRTVDDDAAVLADVQPRLPDILFDNYLRLDLGGRVVELYHFGPGNTPGDTVVYVPDAKVAWTGNLVTGSVPILFNGGATSYLETLSRMTRTLDIETIVPGHGNLMPAAVLARDLSYLSDLIQSVRKSVRSGRTLEETLAGLPLGGQFAPPAESPLAPFLLGVHRLNVQRTYLEMKGG